METQKLNLDRTNDHLLWISDRAPQLQVRRILFHLPQGGPGDFAWVSRLMRAALIYECRVVDGNDPLEPVGAISGGVRFDHLIAPHTMQPMFDINRLWHFHAPLHKSVHGLGKPRWETRLWLDGFEFRDGESAMVMLTMNAERVTEVAA